MAQSLETSPDKIPLMMAHTALTTCMVGTERNDIVKVNLPAICGIAADASKADGRRQRR